MDRHRFLACVAAAALSLVAMTAARAFDEAKYPDWRGMWQQLPPGSTAWDPSKPAGAGQDAPLTAEYRAIYDTSLKSEAEGGIEADPTRRCIPAAFPRVMMALKPMEIVI